MTKEATTPEPRLYAGLDVSVKETAICIVNEHGEVCFEGKQPSDPDAIAATLAAHSGALARAGLESGMTSAWLWRGLRERGVPIVCLDSRHAHRVLSMRHNKNDRNDARGLADIIRMGWYREANIKSLDAQFIRSMLLTRQQLQRARRDIENSIRGTVKALGAMTGPTAGRTFMARIAELRRDNAWLAPILDPMLAAHTSLKIQFKSITHDLMRLAREDPDVRRMMTIPGIGALTALCFKSTIDDPKRFTSSTHVGPYLGLTPRQYQSGDSDWTGSIGQPADAMLRSYLFEAAGVLITRVPRWSPLKEWGSRLAERLGWKRACIAVARKLAVLMHAVWRDGTVFDWGTQPETATA